MPPTAETYNNWHKGKGIEKGLWLPSKMSSMHFLAIAKAIFGKI
jgi:hypothetical protein